MNRALFVFLVALSGLQILGLIFQSKTLRGAGIATVASPLPLVFSHYNGVETFAAHFYVGFYKEGTLVRKVQLTPSLYSKMKGPYNRRNVFGAVVAYGPYATDEKLVKMAKSVIRYGFCESSRLPKEFGLDMIFDEVQLIALPKAKTNAEESSIGVKCQ